MCAGRKEWIQTNKTFQYYAGDIKLNTEGILCHSLHFRKTKADPGICKYGVLEFGYEPSQAGNIIIGVEVLSLIKNDMNGYWRWLDGTVGEDHFKAEFCTSHWREEGKYDLKIWYVEKQKLIE